MLALILVAAAVGLSNLAASVGVGASGVDRGVRLRVGVIFGLLEAGMPIVGLLIGHGLATEVGRETNWLAAGLLVAIGGYGIVKAVREGGLPGIGWRRQGAARGEPAAAGSAAAGPGVMARQAAPGRAGSRAVSGRAGGGQSSLTLLATGLALSLDNLVAGFALGAYQVSLVAGAVVFGVVSTVMSLVGLELGAVLGKRAGGGGELIGGAVLVGVGVAVGMGAFG